MRLTPRHTYSPAKILQSTATIVSPFQIRNKRSPTRGNSITLKNIDKSSTEERHYHQRSTIRQVPNSSQLSPLQQNTSHTNLDEKKIHMK